MAAQLNRKGLRGASVLLALTGALLSPGCVRDACNNECPQGTTCDESLAVCISNEDAGTLLCSQDMDCPGTSPRCNAGGICVQCLGTSDCPSGKTCNSRSNTCVSGCTGPADCQNVANKHQCSLAGECVECTISLHCSQQNGMRRTCDPGTNQCVLNPCSIDADCAQDPSGYRYCSGGGCVQCIIDNDCILPGKSRCTTDTHICAECVGDDDCSVVNGESCVAGTCEKTGCANDSECVADQHCDTANHNCVPCLENSHCNVGGTCQNKHCHQPDSCHADADCIVGTYCFNGACAACRSNADCATGQTCRNDGTCQQPSSCTRSDMCGSGSACIEGSCQSLACVMDSFEANNFPQDAWPLPTMTTLELDASYCPNEPDYYVVALSPGQGLKVEMLPLIVDMAAAHDLTIDLTPVPGTHTTAHSFVRRDGVIEATLERMPEGAKVVLVRIFGNADQATAYGLTATVANGALCTNDPNEPNELQTQAVIVGPGTYQGALCPDDLDWYAIDVPENERPVATLSSNAGAADISVAIYTLKNGTVSLDSYSLTDSTGAATVTAVGAAGTGGQRFWVDVIASAPGSRNYSLKLNVVANPPTNDRCTNAGVLNQNAMVTGTTAGAVMDESASCGGTGGDAFWRLAVSQTSRVELSLAAEFNAVLSVEKTCGQPMTEMACTGGTGQSQRLIFEALPVGIYRIRVAGANAAELGDYALASAVQQATPPTAGSCNAPIALAFNESGIASHPGTVAGADNGIRTCGRVGGEAIYLLDLAEAKKLDVTLTGFAGASISLAPRSSCISQAGAECVAANASGLATLSVNAVPAGQYVLVVDGGTAVSGTYTLEARLSDAIFPPDNDVCGSALDLAAGQSTVEGDTRAALDDFAPVCGAVGAAGDAVYHFSVTTPQEVSFKLNADFDAALELTSGTCGAGMSMDCQLGTHALIRRVLPAGDYYLWVDGNIAETGQYSLASLIEEAPPVPPNQSCDSAIALGTITTTTVTGSTATADPMNAVKPNACVGTGSTDPLPLGGPNVVYSVQIPAGKMLSATLTPQDFDGALFVVSGCSQNTCLAASDQSYEVGVGEAVTVPNSGGTALTVFVVVGSWDASAWGRFSLALQVN